MKMVQFRKKNMVKTHAGACVFFLVKNTRSISMSFLKTIFFFLIAITLLSTNASGDFADGDGSDDDPYEIENWEHLDNVRDYKNVYFRLNNSLNSDTDGYEDIGDDWTPIGSLEEPFTGNFNARGYTIKNLVVDKGSEDNTGLFAFVGSGGTVRNLNLEDADVSGADRVGSLVGTNSGTISNCSSTGNVSGDSQVGGLIGFIKGGSVSGSSSECIVEGQEYLGGFAGVSSGTVSGSYAAGDVSGDNRVGGFVGEVSAGEISSSYSSVNVDIQGNSIGGFAGVVGGVVSRSYATGDVSGGNRVGGFVGEVTAEGNISRSYATGNVDESGEDIGGFAGVNSGDLSHSYAKVQGVSGDSNVGGLAGRVSESGSVKNCYAVVENISGTNSGALIGLNESGEEDIAGSFWDEDSTLETESDGGVGLSTEQMMCVSTFTLAGWDIDEVGKDERKSGYEWNIVDELSYPFLSWESNPFGSGYFESGDGTEGNPYEITSWHQLQNVRHNDESYFILANNLSEENYGYDYRASEISAGGRGWRPIGRLMGSFDGDGNVIEDLYIDRANSDNIGLFGRVHREGEIKNLGLENIEVTGGNYIGGLAGRNEGVVENCYVHSDIKGSFSVGGLIGLNSGNVIDSHAAGNVTGESSLVGGLVGRNREGGEIRGCYAEGDVKGYMDIGGLVGRTNEGTLIEDSYSTGDVKGAYNIGGLAGGNMRGEIKASYSLSGDVQGSENYIGGLVGASSGLIEDCYSEMDVYGEGAGTGGLAGYILKGDGEGKVTGSYSNGSVIGERMVGGFAGMLHIESRIRNSSSESIVTGDSGVGGFVGDIRGGTVENSFSAGHVSGNEEVGGLVGSIDNTGEVKYSFWDIDNSGQFESAGGEGKSFGKMTLHETYSDAGWDIESVEIGSTDEDSAWNIVDVLSYPFPSWEENAIDEYAGGEGTEENPYEIDNWHQLSNVRKNPGAYYILTSDFRETDYGYNYHAGKMANDGAGWEPIDNFSGSLDGDGHTIGALYISRGGEDNIGLFSVLSGEVTNIGIYNVNIAGQNNVGGVAGENTGDISGVYSTGEVTGESRAGGITGENSGGEIISSYSTCRVSASDVVGGLVGNLSAGKVEYSYAAGHVAGDSDEGGLVGSGSGSVTNSFWDTEESGQTDSAGGDGKDTDEMMQLGTYDGWDIAGVGAGDVNKDNRWNVVENFSYPFFSWDEPVPPKPKTVFPEDDGFANTEKVNFKWESAGGKVEYFIQVSTKADLSEVIFSTVTENTSFEIPIHEEKQYYWKIGSRRIMDRVFRYCDIKSFKLDLGLYRYDEFTFSDETLNSAVIGIPESAYGDTFVEGRIRSLEDADKEEERKKADEKLPEGARHVYEPLDYDVVDGNNSPVEPELEEGEFISIKFKYPEDLTRPDEKKLRIAKLEDGQWGIQDDYSINKEERWIRARVSSLSVFALVIYPYETLDNVFIYPSPYKPGDDLYGDVEGGGIMFGGLPDNADIRVFNIAGELVDEFTHRGGTSYRWEDAENMASGVYILVVNYEGDSKTEKFAVVK